MFALLLLVAGADPAPVFTVENKTPPRFVVENKLPMGGKYDPYKMDYPAFHEWVKKGGRGILTVGGTDKWVGTYQNHCHVASGFGGFADGEYDCRLENGRPVMSLVSTASAPAVAPATFSAAGGCGCSAGYNCGASFCKAHGGTGCPASCPIKK